MNSFSNNWRVRLLASPELPVYLLTCIQMSKCIAPTERTILSWTEFGSWMAKSVHKIFIQDFGLPRVQGKEGVELNDLWHEVWEMFCFNVPQEMATGVEGWRQTLFSAKQTTLDANPSYAGTGNALDLSCVPLIPPQDDVIEEISKLSLQGGLEQAVNLLAAGRSWTALRIRSHFEFNLACVKCLKHQTPVNISVAVRSIRNRKK